jgi:hypothetical protein
VIGRELLIGISGRADEKLLVEELRRGEIEARVEPVGVVRLRVFEISSEAERRRELGSGPGVEIGVGAAAVDRAVADADVREGARVVGCGPRCPGSDRP